MKKTLVLLGFLALTGCAASGAFHPDRDRDTSASTRQSAPPEKPDVDTRLARLCPLFPLNRQAQCVAVLLQQ